MRYRSKTGFGEVSWPWWHDAIIVLVVLTAIALADRFL